MEIDNSSPQNDLNNFQLSATDNHENQSNQVQSEDEAFKVFVRARPLNKKECEKKDQRKHLNIIKIQEQMVFVMDPDILSSTNYSKEKSYIFDYVFNEKDNTSFVYQNTMKVLLDNILNGYNATLFAYGMTGAGKTHTLFGDMQKENLNIETYGLIMLTFNDLFEKINNPVYANTQEFAIKMSYLEIYNEQVKDLLTGNNQNLMIIDDPIKGVFVADLLEIQVNTLNDVLNHILLGNSRRTMASTSANQFSSRSHAIIQLTIEKKNKVNDMANTICSSKLSFIDLAGSERASVSDNKGLRMLEGTNINRSLLSLGNCINALSDQNRKGGFVPYRDSKLTRLLKDSLGGNTKTIMIACISPASSCYEESINTLKYASRAKNIKRKIRQNVKEVDMHVTQYKEIIEGMRDEIANLRDQLKAKPLVDIPNTQNQLSKVGDSSPIIRSKSVFSMDDLRQNCIKDHHHDIIMDPELQGICDKIIENLKQNWEINQTLRELNDLEYQNRQALSLLQKKIDNMNDQDVKRIEVINKQLCLLKNTMLNNDKIKKDVENALNKFMVENQELEKKLTQYGYSNQNHFCDDIDLVKKLLSIEKLDIELQNIEIKREALTLMKEKIATSKRIAMLEDEITMMKSLIEEKDRLSSSKDEYIQKLISNQNNKRISAIEKCLPINYYPQDINDEKTKSKILQKPGEANKTRTLKEIPINNEKSSTKSAAPTATESDEKIYRSEVNVFKINIKDIHFAEIPKIQIPNCTDNITMVKNASKKNIKLNDNKVGGSGPIAEPEKAGNLADNKQKNNGSGDKPKTSDLNGHIDPNRLICIGSPRVQPIQQKLRQMSPSNNTQLPQQQFQPASPNAQSAQQKLQQEAQRDLNLLLMCYKKQKTTTQNEEKRISDKKLRSPSSIKMPISPTAHNDSLHLLHHNNKESMKTKRSNENSSEMSLLGKDDILDSYSSLWNLENQKENINMNRMVLNPCDYPKKSDPVVACGSTKNLDKPILGNLKNIGAQVQSKLTTPSSNQQKYIGIDNGLSNTTINDLKLSPQTFCSSSQSDLKESQVETIQPEIKPQIVLNDSDNNSVPVKNNDKPCVSPFGQINTELACATSSNKQGLSKQNSIISPCKLIPTPLSTKNVGFNTEKKFTTTTTETLPDQEGIIPCESKKIYEIKSLDQERENLKLFRTKINTLIDFVFNDRNLSNEVIEEIRSVIQEYELKNYIISLKHQEYLKILGKLTGIIDEKTKQEKELRRRCASIDVSNQPRVIDNRDKSLMIRSRNRMKHNEPMTSKKSMMRSFLSKGSLSNLDINCSQVYTCKNSFEPKTLSDENMLNKQLNNDFSFLSTAKQEDQIKNLAPQSIKNYSIVIRESVEADKELMGIKSMTNLKEPQNTKEINIIHQSFSCERRIDKLREEFSDNIEPMKFKPSSSIAQLEQSKNVGIGFYE